MYCVFATITPKGQYFEAAREAIIGILAKTRQESGCIQFEVHVDQSQTQLYLYERWQDQGALALHYQQPYTQQVFAAYEEWLDIPVAITAMNALG